MKVIIDNRPPVTLMKSNFDRNLRKGSKDQMLKIKKINLEIEGLDFVCDIRSDRRGGGIAFEVFIDKISLKESIFPKKKELRSLQV